MSEIKPAAYMFDWSSQKDALSITHPFELQLRNVVDDVSNIRKLYSQEDFEALQKENNSLKLGYKAKEFLLQEAQKEVAKLRSFDADNKGLKECNSILTVENEAQRNEVEKLKAENEELRHVNLTSLADLHFKNRELESKNEAQAKRIAELEAATAHLGLTPQQAKDGLARHKAQVAEIEALRKQVDERKEWHMIGDEMRKALEAQKNGDSK